ncbi:hypothetical protein [Noviherbaspirillum malthae]|uniref:hypothetical protein n=1 Tax=Noviherbaspirillum malthae TaxID=1260987 RepID=UPI00188ECBAD|nr:hypothetical protein [Noviherbaspirillum malthae]
MALRAAELKRVGFHLDGCRSRFMKRGSNDGERALHEATARQGMEARHRGTSGRRDNAGKIEEPVEERSDMAAFHGIPYGWDAMRSTHALTGLTLHASGNR